MGAGEGGAWGRGEGRAVGALPAPPPDAEPGLEPGLEPGRVGGSPPLDRVSMVGALMTVKRLVVGRSVGKEEGTPGLVPQ